MSDRRITDRRPRVPLKTVAVPNEHGAWALVLEPALLALLVAPSAAGAVLAGAGVTAVMAQHPLALFLTDVRRGKTYPRTGLARRFAALYGAAALLAVLMAVTLAGGVRMLWPLAFAAPLAGVQLWFDTRNMGRELLPEVAGAAAVGALTACMAMAAGWPLVPALGLWLVTGLRSVPSIVWVRARLGLAYERDIDRRPALIASVAAVVIAAALAATGALPWLVVVGAAVLAARAGWGLSRFRRPTQPKHVGMRELAFGLVFVLAAVAGYAWGW